MTIKGRVLALLLALVVASTGSAQQTPSQIEPRGIYVYVEDLKTSVDFYQDVFGVQRVPTPVTFAAWTWGDAACRCWAQRTYIDSKLSVTAVAQLQKLRSQKREGRFLLRDLAPVLSDVSKIRFGARSQMFAISELFGERGRTRAIHTVPTSHSL